jgi:hypothetical protein
MENIAISTIVGTSSHIIVDFIEIPVDVSIFIIMVHVFLDKNQVEQF